MPLPPTLPPPLRAILQAPVPVPVPGVATPPYVPVPVPLPAGHHPPLPPTAAAVPPPAPTPSPLSVSDAFGSVEISPPLPPSSASPSYPPVPTSAVAAGVERVRSVSVTTAKESEEQQVRIYLCILQSLSNNCAFDNNVFSSVFDLQCRRNYLRQ